MMKTSKPARRPTMPPSKNSVTSNDVARLAEVSQSAVSRTFTPGASVSPETRERVMEAARKLGYRPNAIARTLSTRLSRMIAVVVSDLQNQFYPVVIERLSKQLQSNGYHVLLFITDTEDADELLVELMRYQVDGIVMASTQLSSGLAQQIAEARVPVVMFNRVSRAGSISTVSSDNHGGARAVAHYLADTGHRRVAYLAGAEDSSTNSDRERGLIDGLAERGLRIAARANGNYNFERAAQATLEMFTHGLESDRPDALFVASDHMAFAAIDTLRGALGLRVPEDVSVVGFDNVPQADWGAYRLTTVEQDVDSMIDATVRMLLQQLENDVVTRDHVTVATRLVVRGSARLPQPGTDGPQANRSPTKASRGEGAAASATAPATGDTQGPAPARRKSSR
ncbi:LacI family DNA-binding transcriptional regulator [Roseateles violae]|uniref:LacI family DNA-binding transcriptional regulator n=1 Tax=Roseateles violae TaxID=3058042 RepID=A0ABT8DN56_9BURK|nr:LacI family DNA-binding transcriptional regulator [Pelomonas sp. PFR6]MDN3919388.1 LacI family DNA-binding transcriptional regulator [Pelomonas sp. PFR6]